MVEYEYRDFINHVLSEDNKRFRQLVDHTRRTYGLAENIWSLVHARIGSGSPADSFGMTLGVCLMFKCENPEYDFWVGFPFDEALDQRGRVLISPKWYWVPPHTSITKYLKKIHDLDQDRKDLKRRLEETDDRYEKAVKEFREFCDGNKT